MKQFYVILIIIVSTSVFAQGGDLEWAKTAGGKSGDDGLSITTDVSGSVYVTGVFNDTADFDPGPATFNLVSKGSNDMFIQKLDASGNLIWAKSFGGVGFFDRGYSITTDNSGNIYLTGNYQDTVDFDPDSLNFYLVADSIDAFILKLDTNGDFKWVKSIGGSDFDQGLYVATDGLGNVYTAGVYKGVVDFDPGPGNFNLTANGAFDTYIQKLDSNGNFVWAKSIGGPSDEFGYSLSIDDIGNVYLSGYYAGMVDFDPGSSNFNLTSKGPFDVFVLKLNSNGNFSWAKSVGGIDGAGFGYFMTIDFSGNLYIGGGFQNTIDLNPGVEEFNLTSNGDHDTFILKLNSNGNFIWAKSFGGAFTDIAYCATTDIWNNVYMIGTYGETVDFDPGANNFNQTSMGGRDIYIQKLDSNGNFSWVKTIGGTSFHDRGFSITSDLNGDIYATGHYASTVDFDPGPATFNMTAIGGIDIYILKLSRSTGLDEISLSNDFSIFPNPSNGQFTIEANGISLGSQLFVYNSIGQIVYKKHFLQSEKPFKRTININEKPGVYIVRLTSGHEMFNKKIVIDF